MSTAVTVATTAVETEDAALLGFALGIADDFELLADLHDREPSKALVEALKDDGLESSLAIVLRSARSRAAFEAFAEAVREVPAPVDQRVLDDLAAAYADVYFRHSYRASPAESVWLTEDGLEQQAPMFRIRAWYRRHHLRVTDPANRPDDHVVLQLRFLAHAASHAKSAADLAEVAQFLDEHLLLWIDRFASRLAETGAPLWFAALAEVTASYLEEVRGHLTVITGRERTVPEVTADTSCGLAGRDAAGPYMPGVAPSW